jgi:ligand-binding sensor domain-containing protein
MLKRFTAMLVVLMILASMGTVFAAPFAYLTMSDSKKTMNDLIKGEQMITNEKDAITAFKDQMILMMYIRAIDQMMMAMTPDQMKLTAQSFLKTQTTLETKEQMIMSIHKMLLDMNQDQLSSMLDKEMPVMSLNAQRNMLKGNNSAITATMVKFPWEL